MSTHVPSRHVRVTLAMVFIVVAVVGFDPLAAGAACIPLVSMTTQRSQADGTTVGLDVVVTATGAVSGDNRLVRVRLVTAQNASVLVGGVARPVPSEITVSANTSSWSFNVRQTQVDTPFLVSFVATDACGDVRKFVGAGSEAARVQPAPTLTPLPTPTSIPTPTPAPPDCTTRLQQRIDAAASGATVTVPACVYREAVVASRPLILVGSPGAEIRGSDVWTNWTRSGALWTRSGVPSFVGNGICRVEVGDRCRRREQVFFDGQPLVQVTANPASGQFAIVGGAVFLADDPTGHTVEVSTRASWLRAASPDVTVRGFTMRHVAVDAQQGGVTNEGFSRLTVQDNALFDAHGAAVSLNGGAGHRLLNNEIGRSGQEGVHITGTSDVLVQNNRISGGNTEGFDPDWEAGGLKATVSTRLTLTGNQVSQNDGPGLWCDLNCTSIVMAGNRLSLNQRAGILFELSDGAQITDNVAWENGWGHPAWGWGGGIVVSTSKNAVIGRNTVAWNADGISVLEQDREPDLTVTGISVSENVIALRPSLGSTYALGWLSDVSPSRLYAPAAVNLGQMNRYWVPNPDNGSVQFAWTDDYAVLGTFNATPGEEGGRYLTTLEKDQALGAAGIPVVPVAR